MVDLGELWALELDLNLSIWLIRSNICYILKTDWQNEDDKLAPRNDFSVSSYRNIKCWHMPLIGIKKADIRRIVHLRQRETNPIQSQRRLALVSEASCSSEYLMPFSFDDRPSLFLKQWLIKEQHEWAATELHCSPAGPSWLTKSSAL